VAAGLNPQAHPWESCRPATAAMRAESLRSWLPQRGGQIQLEETMPVVRTDRREVGGLSPDISPNLGIGGGRGVRSGVHGAVF
jgi:hypothetical protein